MKEKCFPENLRWEYRMFSAYWLSISEINLPKSVEWTSENKNVFLANDAATECDFPECPEMQRNVSHFLIYIFFFKDRLLR